MVNAKVKKSPTTVMEGMIIFFLKESYLLIFNQINKCYQFLFYLIRSIDNSTVVVHPRASTSMTTMTSLSPSTPQQCDLFIVHETSL